MKKMGRNFIKVPTDKLQFMKDCLTLDFRDVSKKYGVSRMTLNRWRKELGIMKLERGKK
jgi:transposase-like protein